MRAVGAVIAAAVLWTASPAAAAEPEPPKLPAPTYQSVSKEILIPMDDGVNIAATVALPSRDGKTPLPGRFPVVLGMTPYGRTTLCSCYPPDFWATRGIVGAAADVRGTGGSGGNLEGNYFSPREARDSAAVIDHLGSQPYSSGKVGMAGGSYVGITQYLAAARRPRHLAAIAPQVALSDLYRDAYAHGGVPNLFFDTQYIAVQGAPGAAGPNSDPALLEATLMAKLGQSPPGTIAFDYLSRPNDDPFYRDRSPIYSADAIQVPTLIVGGWSDGLSQRGGPEMYRRLARRRGVETRLYMDPCTHKGCAAPFAPLTDPRGSTTSARWCSSSCPSTCVARARRSVRRWSTTCSRRGAMPPRTGGRLPPRRGGSSWWATRFETRRPAATAAAASSAIRRPASAWRSTSTARWPRRRTCRPTSGSKGLRG